MGDLFCVRCGHPRSAHAHYRAGTDCGLCDCARFRRVTVADLFWTCRALLTSWLHRHRGG